MKWICGTLGSKFPADEQPAGQTLYTPDKFIEVKYTKCNNPSDQFGVGTIATQQIIAKTYEEIFTVGTQYKWALLNHQAEPEEGEDPEYHNFGRYKCIGIDKTKEVYTWTFLDTLSYANKSVDSWYNGVTYPNTIEGIVRSLATYCNCTIPSGGFHYGGVDVTKQAFTATNLNGQTILRYASQILAGWAEQQNPTDFDDLTAVWDVNHYSRTSKLSVDNSWYTFAKLELNPTSIINRFCYKKDKAGKKGIFEGIPGNNELWGDTSNRWFYEEFHTNSGWGGRGQWLVNYLSGGGISGDPYDDDGVGSYYPGTIKTNQWNTLEVGDRIKVDGKDFLIMQLDIDESGWQFKCFGKPENVQNTSLVEEIGDVPSDVLTQTNLNNGLTGTGSNAALDIQGRDIYGNSIHTRHDKDGVIFSGVAPYDIGLAENATLNHDGFTSVLMRDSRIISGARYGAGEILLFDDYNKPEFDILSMNDQGYWDNNYKLRIYLKPQLLRCTADGIYRYFLLDWQYLDADNKEKRKGLSTAGGFYDLSPAGPM